MTDPAGDAEAFCSSTDKTASDVVAEQFRRKSTETGLSNTVGDAATEPEGPRRTETFHLSSEDQDELTS